MRSLPYLILAYLTLGVQVGLGDLAAWHGARSDLVLIAVLFVALNAPRDAALLSCFGLGLLQDILCQQPPGLYALSYGLVAMLVAGTQQPFYRTNPLAHMIFALVGGFVVATVLVTHGWLRPPGPKVVVNGTVVAGAIRTGAAALFASAGYTALLAVPLLWLLNRFKRAFAFHGYYRRAFR